MVSLLYAASGLGLLLGFALLISRSTRFPAVTVTIAGFVISSAGNLLTGLSSVIAAAFAMQLVRGVGISLVEVGLTTLVQRTVPPVSSHRADGVPEQSQGHLSAGTVHDSSVVLSADRPRRDLMRVRGAW